MSRALDGVVALVAGGGSGIGLGVVDRYVCEGGQVAVLEAAPEKVAHLRATRPEVLVIEGDVRAPDDNRRAVQATIERFGRLSVLVANAGVYDGSRTFVSIDEDQLGDAFDELFAVNVKGLLLIARAAVDELRAQRGTMIFTCSYASFNPAGGGVLYTASKHAVAGVVRQLAYELAPEVRVVGVAPGATTTTMRGIQALGQDVTPSLLPGTEAALPIGYLPAPDEYAGVYVLLASPRDARVMTGCIIDAANGLGVRGIVSPRDDQIPVRAGRPEGTS